MSILRRCASVGMILLLALLLNVQVVEAGRLWCSADPVITLDHRVVDISLAMPLEDLLLVNGPTVIVITTPPSVDRQLIVNDVGFMGYGSIVIFKDGGGVVEDNEIPVKINASVSIDQSQLAAGETVPLKITVLVDDLHIATALGTTDKTTVKLVVIGN